MRARLRLSSVLDIRPGEGRLVALLVVHSLFIGIGQLFTDTVTEPLFLVNFGAERLPYLYTSSAITTTLAGFLYAKLAERIRFTTLLVVNLSVILLATCGFRMLLWLPGVRWPIVVLAIWSYVQDVLLNLEFWTLAGRLFNVRQGKRLFGVIGSGKVVATIGGGALTPVLVSLLGTPNLLWVAMGGVGGALLSLILLVRQFTSQLDAPVDEEEEGESTLSYRELFKNRYVVMILVFTSLSWLVYYFVDNAFYDQAAARYRHEDQLASFLGVFGAVTGFLTLLSGAFVSGPVVNRYGLLVGLLVSPVVVAAGSASTAITGTLLGAGAMVFWLATMTKLLHEVLESSVYQSSFLTLYQPLPPDQRLRVQTTTESVVEPIAVAAAGLALLVLINVLGFGAIQLFYATLAILVALITVGLILGRMYPAALMHALAKRRLGGVELSLADRSSVAVVQQSVRSSHVGVILYALDVLEAIKHESLAALLQDLLEHPAPEVRQDVLARIERLDLTAALEAVRKRLLVETSAPVRGAAVRTLAALGEVEAIDEVAAYLDDPEPAIKLGAMVGLLRSGGIEGVLLAGEKLIELAHVATPAHRVLAARALGEVGIAHFYRPLVPLLHDETPEVREAALAAAGKLKNAKLWPLVVAALALPEVRGAAAAALVAGGESVLPELRTMFTSRAHQRELLIRAARICGRIRGNGAVVLLEEQIAFPDPDVRAQVLVALSRCGYHAQGPAAARVREQIIAEIGDAVWLVAALVDIGDGPHVSLLHAALTYRLHLARERLLLLLSFVYDAQAILRARDNLVHASGAQRAYALEVLDIFLSQELKPLLFAVFDDLAPAERLRRLHASFPQPHLPLDERLRQIVADPDSRRHPWIKACALYALASVVPAGAPEPLVAALSARDSLVRETAAWALGKLERAVSGSHLAMVGPNPDPEVVGVVPQPEVAGDGPMLSTIEKVLILKTVSIFAGTPDEVLAEVASLLEEVEVPGGRTIFEKGDIGTCMYIIVDGRVRVHDGERTLNELGERDVFGEMAVLDAAPRVASVTAVEDTRLFRLDQEPLYELMADRIEVVRGIIRVLSGHLRARVHDVAQLHARVQELAARNNPDGGGT